MPDAVTGLMPDGVVTMPKSKLANAVTLGRLPMFVPEWPGGIYKNHIPWVTNICQFYPAQYAFIPLWCYPLHAINVLLALFLARSFFFLRAHASTYMYAYMLGSPTTVEKQLGSDGKARSPCSLYLPHYTPAAHRSHPGKAHRDTRD